MKDRLLKYHALVFAACLGVVAFVLAFFSAAVERRHGDWLVNALIISFACAVLSWGAANRLLAMISDAVSAAVNRLAAAAAGDLNSPTPDSVADSLPDLSNSIDSLFRRVRHELESANTLALFDTVTALPNRVHFRNDADTILSGLRKDAVSALLFIDLDNFKAVNDSLGHAAGDQLLIMIANRLRAIASSAAAAKPGAAGPVLGRLAGDEFTMLLPDIKTPAAAGDVAQQILGAIAEPYSIAGQQVSVGASIGIAVSPLHGYALPQLMRAADVAMYDAKEKGRNCFRFYTEALAQRLAARNRLDHDLRHAVDRNEFGFEFQPQVSLADHRPVAAESLLRWYHPAGVRVPRDFLGAAEECGIVGDLGDWSLDTLAATLGRWHRDGRALRLAVNVTPHQFARGGLYDRTMAAMRKHGAPLAMLELEIADRMAMEAGEILLEDLAALRREGAIVSLDNVGRNALHIGRLRALPADRVKIDRSLVKHIAGDAEARAILHALISMLNTIGRETVATGVETAEQLDILRVMGCGAVQGYALAKPMDDHGLVKWLGAMTEPAAKRA